MAPAQVSNGQSFRVGLEVRNTGGAAALGVSPSVPQLTGTGAATMSGAAPAPQDIPGGQSRLFSYPLVATQSGTISVSASASGVDEISLRPVDGPAGSGQVLVQERPVLDAVAQPPAQQIVSVGQTVSLSLVVTNSGTATAMGVSFPAPTVGPDLQLVSSPLPQDVFGAMGTATFTWTYQAAQPGFDSPTISGGTGADANDGTAIPVSAAGWPQMVVQAPAQLSVSASPTIPAKVNVGQTFSVTILATNSGEAAALGVVPTIVSQSGTAQVATVNPPPVARDIGASASASFTWKMTATAAGSFSLSFGVAGSDANSGTAVQSPQSTPSQILVQTPAQFTNATLTASPAQVTIGQEVTLTLVMTNSGEATAIKAAPFTTIVLQTTSGQTARIAVPFAAQPVPGGTVGTWVWSESSVTSTFLPCTCWAIWSMTLGSTLVCTASRTFRPARSMAVAVSLAALLRPAAMVRCTLLVCLLAGTAGMTAASAQQKPDEEKTDKKKLPKRPVPPAKADELAKGKIGYLYQAHIKPMVPFGLPNNYFPEVVVAADFDKDGRLDLAVGMASPDRIVILLNRANPQHGAWAWYSMFSVALTDVYIRLLMSGVLHEPRVIF